MGPNRAAAAHRPAAPVRPTASPLGLDCYADPDLYALERARLFHPAHGPFFVGHESLLGGPGHAAAEADERVLLTRTEDGTIRAFANLCTHAMRPLVREREQVAQSCVTCPYHQWSFRRDGSFIGARSMPTAPGERSALALPEYPVHRWRGSIFCGADTASLAADLEVVEDAFAGLGCSDWLEFSDWTLVASEDEAYAGDWKSFVEVYGDCYHVPPFHPGLASFADCDTLRWVFGAGMHLQVLDLSPAQGAKSPYYAAWVDGLRRYTALKGEPEPSLAVVWSAFYPNLMIEYYNGLRVVSVIVPTGPDSYRNRVRYYVPPDMEALVPGLPAAILEAYGETAEQDRGLNESRHEGLLMAAELGLRQPAYVPNLTGPAPELGTVHFHSWWRTAMARPAPVVVGLPAVGVAQAPSPVAIARPGVEDQADHEPT